MKAPSHSRDRFVGAQQSAGGHLTERDHHGGLNRINLRFEKAKTRVHLLAIRRSITRRTAFDDVCNVDIRSVKIHGLDHAGQQLTGSAHKGTALSVLVRAGTFSHKHESRVRIALTKNNIEPFFVQGASRAFSQFGSYGIERTFLLSWLINPRKRDLGESHVHLIVKVIPSKVHPFE